MQQTHINAEKRYDLYRQESRLQAQSILPVKFKNSVKLAGIDQKAIIQSKLWEKSELREVDWNWQLGHNAYKKRYPKRFELAIWYQSILCGLSIGRPSYAGSRLRLDFAERAPENCPIKGHVMQLTLLAAESYALSIGADEVRIMHPLNERLVNYYNRLGYQYVEGGSNIGTVNESKPHYLYRLI